MKLATIRRAGGTRAVRVGEDGAVELGHPDLGALLARPDWRAEAAGATGPPHPVDGLDYAPVVLRPEKILCVGLNYATHIREMGLDLPEYPTLFASIITLAPGDLIATGTPVGVGHAREPARYLVEGSEVVTRVEGVGECRKTGAS